MPAPLELRIQNGDARWRLQPYATVEVWRGRVLVGTLSGASLTLLVEHTLAQAALAAVLQAELARPDPLPSDGRLDRALAFTRETTPPATMLAAPPTHPVPRDVRAALRDARRRPRRRA